MCFAPGRTAMLGPVAERHPQLTLILDHMGVTAAMVKDNKLEEGIGQTVALATDADSPALKGTNAVRRKGALGP
jgi:predicted TIM-barrel fold metal-dependent hydrolase